ncbi:MAG: universal stress protein [Paracoccaceae bacterium]
MSYQNILAAYSATVASDAALALAFELAKKSGAHVTGLLAHGLPASFYNYATHLPHAAVLDSLTEADKARREEVRDAFFAKAGNFPADRLHYLEMRGEPDLRLIEAARAYDLTVMGPADSTSEFPHMEGHPDVVAREAGRPVLLAPVEPDAMALNGHVLIAWDGGNAAARAVADALPLIKDASTVSVLSVGASEDQAQAVNRFITHLERHGKRPKLISKPKARGRIGDFILTTAAEISAGMVVMGAYEHSKFAEDLFGGVTNRVMAKANIPILMSH